MNVIDSLSSSQGEKGNSANLALAKSISNSGNELAVGELASHLNHTEKKIQADCIKVLYEIATIKPELIAPHYEQLLQLLSNKNNRLVWGGMTALAAIVPLKHQELYASMSLIIDTMAKGSVITIDQGVNILAHLCTYDNYCNKVEPVLLEQLWKCPIKQLPMYMEQALNGIKFESKGMYLRLISQRKTACEKESQLKRLEKISKKIEAINAKDK